MAANTAGLVLSGLALVDDSITWFRRARFAKCFPGDLDRSQLMLDTLCWKLFKWADFHHSYSQERNAIPPDALLKLDQIKHAFKKAGEQAEHYQALHPSHATNTIRTGNFRELNESTKELHETILARIKSGPLCDSTLASGWLWILYRREEFNDLVRTVTESINWLYEFMPVNKQQFNNDREELFREARNTSGSSHLDLLRRMSNLKWSFDPREPTTAESHFQTATFNSVSGTGNHFGSIVESGASGPGFNQQLEFGQFSEQGTHVGLRITK